MAALSEGGKLHKYGPMQGDPELREILSGVIAKEIGVRYDPQDIAITVGAKGSIDILVWGLLELRETVGIMTPFWVTYPEFVKIAQGIPCFLESDRNLRPAPEKIAERSRSKEYKGVGSIAHRVILRVLFMPKMS